MIRFMMKFGDGGGGGDEGMAPVVVLCCCTCSITFPHSVLDLDWFEW